MKLTSHQTDVKQEVVTFFMTPNEPFHILKGFGGSGKSFLLTDIYNSFHTLVKMGKLIGLPKKQRISDIRFTATTHQAISNLREMLELYKTSNTLLPNIDTIHSFMGVRMQTDYSTGKSTYVETGQGLYNECEILEGITVIVIDEGSYLTEPFLQIMFRKLDPDKFKVLIVGDPYQLINHDDGDTAPAFNKGWEESTLSQMMRTNDADLEALVMDARQGVIENRLPTININGSSIVHMDRPSFENEMLTNFNADIDNFLAYQNDRVSFYNTALHKHFTGKDFFVKGDTVISNYYVGNKSRVIRNNEKVKIGKIQEVQNKICIPSSPYRFTGYEVFIGSTKFLMPHSRKHRKQIFDELKESGDYNALKAMYGLIIELRHSYASTIHKAQGATKDTIYLDLDDVNDARRLNELCRLLYVGIGRAKTKLVLVGDITK